jgi:hypothetical protein
MAWSKNYEHCIDCGTTERAHMARGLCSACYLKKWNSTEEHIASQKLCKRRWHENNIKGTARAIMAREQNYFAGNRSAVLKRDGWTCQTCGSKGPLVVHHADGTGRYSPTRDHTVEHLVTLCRACHARLHSTANQWARNYTACIVCGRTDRKHNAKGMCWSCYLKQCSAKKQCKI